jgi:hypothetical protein
MIVKRGGLVVSTRRQREAGGPPLPRLEERASFGTAAAIAGDVYTETAAAAEELTQVLRLTAARLVLLRNTCALANRLDMFRKVGRCTLIIVPSLWVSNF